MISSALASALGLELGDRLTMMIMDTEGRARPYLLTVRGIFASVYPQLDSHLIYVPLELVDGTNTWEILLAEGEDDASVLSAIRNEGIFARSYREIYSSAYRNIGTSLSVMHLVLAAVAVLAAYFSSDIAESYTSRDEKDITLSLLKLYAAFTDHLHISASSETYSGFVLPLSELSAVRTEGIIPQSDPYQAENSRSDVERISMIEKTGYEKAIQASLHGRKGDDDLTYRLKGRKRKHVDNQ